MDGQTDGSLVYRVADGKLLASGDGVYFTALCPWSSTGWNSIQGAARW
ncbi:hypothetical protein M5E87_15505 [Flavonifractor plautii]|nr:hypothetical protein M5E87_15505 [Flavonifractor plautii]